MEKIIERNVPIAEENVTLSGQPATNMFEDWGEDITETDLLHEEKDKGFSPKKNPKKLMKEMDQIVQDDIKTFINNYSSNPLYYFTFVLG
jgi:hypothetical protein